MVSSKFWTQTFSGFAFYTPYIAMTRNNLCIISISYVDNWPKSCFLRPIQAVRKKSKHSLTSIHTLTFGTVLGIDIGSTAITSVISAAFGISYIITKSVTYPSHICTGFKKIYLKSGDTKFNTIQGPNLTLRKKRRICNINIENRQEIVHISLEATIRAW